MANFVNYYVELGLDRNMSCEELKDALGKLRRKWQTRANSGETLEARQKAERMMQLIRDASAVLLVEAERKKYDKSLDKDPQTAGSATRQQDDSAINTSFLDDADALDRLQDAYEHGRYNTVFALANNIIASGKADFRVYRLLVLSYAEVENISKAISTLNDMLKVMPENLDAHFLYAFAMLRVFKGKAADARASLDYLIQNENPISARVAALDVEYYLDSGDFALADAKTEEYKAIVGRDKEFTESIGRAYRQLSESYLVEYGGDVYLDSKEDYENWKKYAELSLSVYPDSSYQKQFQNNLKIVGGVTFLKENFSGIIFSLLLGFIWTNGGGSSATLGIAFILMGVYAAVFSFIPKWSLHRYTYTGELPIPNQIARWIAKISGIIVNAIIWFVKTIFALVFSFF